MDNYTALVYTMLILVPTIAFFAFFKRRQRVSSNDTDSDEIVAINPCRYIPSDEAYDGDGVLLDCTPVVIGVNMVTCLLGAIADPYNTLFQDDKTIVNRLKHGRLYGEGSKPVRMDNEPTRDWQARVHEVRTENISHRVTDINLVPAFDKDGNEVTALHGRMLMMGNYKSVTCGILAGKLTEVRFQARYTYIPLDTGEVVTDLITWDLGPIKQGVSA